MEKKMSFEFDDSKTFSGNFDLFLEETKEIDPEMAEILIQNADHLRHIVSNGERNTQARTEFNSLIVTALDESIKSQPEDEEN
jgi:hypothetical protein